MSDVFQFIQENGAGIGTLTVYTAVAIYLVMVEPANGLSSTYALIFAVGPAIVIYEISKEFTDWIIKQTLEHHVAIARVQLEIEHGGEFDDWYSGDNESEINDLDKNAQNEVTTALCAILIGGSAPFVGWFSFQYAGLFGGVFVSVICFLVVMHSAKTVANTIERTPEVVNT